MIKLQGRGIRQHRRQQSSTESTDSILSQKKKRQFLSLISSQVPKNRLERADAVQLKKFSELKKLAMGHRTSASVGSQFSDLMTAVEQKQGVEKDGRHRAVKKASLSITTDIMGHEDKLLQTPIHKLLFESSCKENRWKNSDQ